MRILLALCVTLVAFACIISGHQSTLDVTQVINTSSQVGQPIDAILLASASANDSQSLSEGLKRVLSQMFNTSEEVVECTACQSVLSVFKVMTIGLGVQATEDALLAMCPVLDSRMPLEVCQGLIRQQASPVAELFTSDDFKPLGFQGKLFCYSVLGMCPKPVIQPYRVPFPKPRPPQTKRPSRSGQTITALHLSDWHVQLDYTTGSEARCNNFVCCIGHNSTSVDVQEAAEEYGNYNCDAPPVLATDMLENIESVSGKPALSIFTGDVDDHALWRDDVEYSTRGSEAAYATLHRHIDAMGSKLYPTFGNHESGPANQYASLSQHSPSMQSWLYTLEAQLWKGWLDKDALDMLRNNGHGSYSVQPKETPKLRIISLNTNLGYILNWFTYWRTDNHDPSGLFAFLVKELQEAEDAGQAAWIIMHVPPTQSDALVDFGNYYLQIIERYNDTITAQFAGHTHRDEFSVEYDSRATRLDGQSAIGVVYIGPSVTPYTSLNPGWRTYEVDSGSYEVMDSHTYIANLSLSPSWSSSNRPSWFKEYSAREAYVADWPASEPLTPAFWDAAAEEILRDEGAWNRFFTYRGKSSGHDGSCSFGHDCQTLLANDLKASESDDYITPVGGARKRNVKRDARQAHEQRGAQSWDRPLCIAKHVASSPPLY